MKDNEDGVNAGVRNFGRLALALIPWALGIGFAAWLGVWVALHQYRHELSQEDRAAVYVGAAERPKSKLAVDIIPQDCSVITRADINGEDLLLYAKNNCHAKVRYMEWHWEALSPDRTVIHGGYENWKCPDVIMPGDVAECKLSINMDDRTAVIRVWTKVSLE